MSITYKTDPRQYAYLAAFEIVMLSSAVYVFMNTPGSVSRGLFVLAILVAIYLFVGFSVLDTIRGRQIEVSADSVTITYRGRSIRIDARTIAYVYSAAFQIALVTFDNNRFVLPTYFENVSDLRKRLKSIVASNLLRRSAGESPETRPSIMCTYRANPRWYIFLAAFEVMCILVAVAIFLISPGTVGNRLVLPAFVSIVFLFAPSGIVDLMRSKIEVSADVVRYTHLGRTREIDSREIAFIEITPGFYVGMPGYTVVVTYDRKRILLPAATYFADGERLVQNLKDLAAYNMRSRGQGA